MAAKSVVNELFVRDAMGNAKSATVYWDKNGEGKTPIIIDNGLWKSVMPIVTSYEPKPYTAAKAA